MPRFLRTCLPQSSRSAWSSTLTFRVFGQNPAARTASFQPRKHRKMKYAEIPDRAINSDREGARPSWLAMRAMESMMCRLFDIFEAVVAEPLSLYSFFLLRSILPVHVGHSTFFRSHEPSPPYFLINADRH